MVVSAHTIGITIQQRCKYGTGTKPDHLKRVAADRRRWRSIQDRHLKLEGGDGRTLEVVSEDGTSIVRDDLFDDDRAAFEEAVTAVRSEGAGCRSPPHKWVISFGLIALVGFLGP